MTCGSFLGLSPTNKLLDHGLLVGQRLYWQRRGGGIFLLFGLQNPRLFFLVPLLLLTSVHKVLFVLAIMSSPYIIDIYKYRTLSALAQLIQ